MKRITLILLLCCTGCASGSWKNWTNARSIEAKEKAEANGETSRQKFERECDEMMGKSEDAFIETYGAPERVDNVGSYKVYVYAESRGVSSFGFVGSSAMSSRSVAHYSKTRFYFKDGKATSWDYESR